MPISVRKFGSPYGIYGNGTVSSIKKFQQKHGLPSDGVAGQNTLAKLDQLLPTAGQPLPDLPGEAITHRVQLHFKSISMPRISEYSAMANANWVCFDEVTFDFIRHSTFHIRYSKWTRIAQQRKTHRKNNDAGAARFGSSPSMGPTSGHELMTDARPAYLLAQATQAAQSTRSLQAYRLL